MKKEGRQLTVAVSYLPYILAKIPAINAGIFCISSFSSLIKKKRAPFLKLSLMFFIHEQL